MQKNIGKSKVKNCCMNTKNPYTQVCGFLLALAIVMLIIN